MDGYINIPLHSTLPHTLIQWPSGLLYSPGLTSHLGGMHCELHFQQPLGSPLTGLCWHFWHTQSLVWQMVSLLALLPILHSQNAVCLLKFCLRYLKYKLNMAPQRFVLENCYSVITGKNAISKLMVLVLVLCFTCGTSWAHDGLSVCHLERSQIGLQAIFPLDSVMNNLKM